MKILFLFFFMVRFLMAQPSRTIPEDSYWAFTMNNQIPVTYHFLDESYSIDQPLIYTVEQIENYVEKAKMRWTHYYGSTDTYLYDALDHYSSYLKGKDVAIVGSQTPWYESIVIAYEARPITIEYNKIISLDPRLKVLTVDEYNADPQLFDAILSISTFEHDGLGRYGDPICPDGDLRAMDKAKSMLKKDGLLFLSVPVGKDYLVWNLHRIYGHHRLKALLKGWQILGYFGFTSEDLEKYAFSPVHQPVFVLRPK